MTSDFLNKAKTQFQYFKMLGEKKNQLNDELLFTQFNEEINSIVTIEKHLLRNINSLWIDFLISSPRQKSLRFQVIK